jgi:PHD/YefM family antitoxin component YafN of YafNO toxin-antitoxin module
MLTIHPQYITDHSGEKIFVVIPISEFNNLIEELEELEDVRLYDEAKKEDNGERISLSDYLKSRKK